MPRKYHRSKIPDISIPFPDSLLTATSRQWVKFTLELAPQFVALWNGCVDIAQFCSILNISPRSAQLRAYSLRRKGAELKELSLPEPVEKRAEAAVFAAAWNTAPDVKTAAKALEMSVLKACNKAKKLSALGVELQKFSGVALRPLENTEVFTLENTLPPPLAKSEAAALAFETVWNASDSVEEVAKALGLTKTSARGKAYRLRKAGRELQRFREFASVRASSPSDYLSNILAFVKVWNAAPSAKDAAQTLGLDRVKARNRACTLRKQGHVLKVFTAGSRRVLQEDSRNSASTSLSPALTAHIRKARMRRERFVALWNTSDTLEEAAQQVGMSAHKTFKKAWFLRKEGFELKTFSSEQPERKAVRPEKLRLRLLRALRGDALTRKEALLALSESDKAKAPATLRLAELV